MISKITLIIPDGEYTGDHGTLFGFKYTFEDTTMMKANHKTETCPFKVGDEVEYEVKGTNNYGKWGKVGKPQPEGGYTPRGGGGKAPFNKEADDARQLMIVKQSSLSRALEYETLNGREPSKEIILETADLFVNWVMNPRKIEVPEEDKQE